VKIVETTDGSCGYEAMSPREELPSLTALRGIAACAVMLYHFAPIAFAAVPAPISRGYLAVDFFFLLSGFVLTYAYGDGFVRRLSCGTIRDFLWTRLARIYPVHLLTMALLVPTIGTSPYRTPQALLYNVLLLHGPWLPEMTWNDPSWSISAEWHAYLLFPLIVGPILLCRRRYASLIGIVALATAVLASTASGDLNITNGPLSLARALPEFLGGMLLYRAFRSSMGAAVLARDEAFLACAVIVVAGASSAAADWSVVAALPLLLLAAAHNRGWIARMFQTRSMRFLGEISYSLYMVHLMAGLVVFPVMHAGVIDRWVLLALAIGFSLATASAISRTVEYPARAWLRSIASFRAPLAASPRH
jgi:peptidoglycan/LPS O-acetylase OafA/YrhL